MKKLTKQEEEVMKVIWSLGSCGVKDIVDQLPEPQPPYTTVASIVSNLKDKNFVVQGKQGKAYIYQPAITENDYKKRFMKGFVHDYFRNSFKDMVSFFAKDEQLTQQDLQDIIHEIEDGEDKK
ncbi:MAG: BlaI/MecI/CopY family transcriptional regulator [Prevotella sp.]|jgi:predicted transcriptional regulator|nr:BlaI/MecI/CopY family transcriptional regulator [Prevotella sp.]MCH4182360.1 BlaI/MecI/CopY family transcriptional regulator [Prevotella sp.]MCH4212481.1 BlaI/MecI/CopY family transcriptional regulator [Prevotella sp.]MCH4240712.1 BlaI/MecI/CopY family transcriptional regulator [Prevotella sp.]MCI1742091.1 BlaI/MecI/CopY family transcriptional regulator [Prevotella sp.]